MWLHASSSGELRRSEKNKWLKLGNAALLNENLDLFKDWDGTK